MFHQKSTSAHLRFLDRLKGAPLMVEAMQQVEAHDLAQRKELVDEMNRALRTAGAYFAERKVKEDALRAELEEIDRRRAVIGQELQMLEAGGSNLRSETNRTVFALAEEIRAGADLRIPMFIVWAQHAHQLAVGETWIQGNGGGFEPHSASERAHAQNIHAAARTAAEVGRLVTEGLARADAMMLEAISTDDVNLELSSMAAAIHAEYTRRPKSKALSPDYTKQVPGVQVLESYAIN